MPVPVIGAYVAEWTLRKALPWLIIAVLSAALVGLWKWDANTIDGLTAERDSARGDVQTARADVARWTAMANTAQAANERHNAEAEKARADLAATEAVLATADAVAKAEAAELTAEIVKWKEKARANPQDVRPVGPIARDAYCSVLRERAGQIPAGCPAAR